MVVVVVRLEVVGVVLVVAVVVVMVVIVVVVVMVDTRKNGKPSRHRVLQRRSLAKKFSNQISIVQIV